MGPSKLVPNKPVESITSEQIYQLALWILEYCHRTGCLFAVENPHRSWLWTLLADLFRTCDNRALKAYAATLEHVIFDQCMHGGARDKRTKILASPGLFAPLAADCDQSHDHSSWIPYTQDGRMVYPTATEAEYPALLSKRMAACVVEAVHQLGLTPQVHPRLKDLLTYSLGAQTIRHPPLVPEYREFAYLDQPVDLPTYKLLASPVQGANTETLQVDTPQKKSRVRHTYKYGILREPAEFLEQARQVVHPIDTEHFIHEATHEAIKCVITTKPVTLAKQRLQVVLNLRKLADELAPKEKELKGSMDPQLRERLKEKNIVLFEHLLKKLEYEDLGVIDLLVKGVPLVGMQEAPNGCKPLVVPATMTQDELEASTYWRRKSVMGAKADLTPADEEELAAAAQKEVSLGFLEGPFTESQLDGFYGHQKWLLNPRFALHQGLNKVRVIDDAKASSLNTAYSSTFKLQLQDNDYIAAMIRATMIEQKRQGLSDTWLGRTLDLSKAYKQLAIMPGHAHLAVVGFPVRGQWQFYRSVALPFGATGSVYGFVRVSRALWFVVTKLLKAITSHYFDDFPMIERTAGARVLSLSFGAILDLLGWQYAKEGDKASDFALAFDALGVTYTLNHAPSGGFEVANKAGRLEKICELLEAIEKRGIVTGAQAAEVQGLLNFACGFFSTKAVRQLVSAFAPLADDRSPEAKRKLVALCRYSRAILVALGPRSHRLTDTDSPYLIFTDGAFEGGRASAGAVIVDTARDFGSCFAVDVPQDLLNLWLETTDQVICQIELWAFVAVRWDLRATLLNRRVIAWIDNEAARISLIKAASHSPTMAAMCQVCCDMEISHPTMLWIERVPSVSNPADLPSRHQARRASESLGLNLSKTLHCDSELVRAVGNATKHPFAVPHTTGA